MPDIAFRITKPVSDADLIDIIMPKMENLGRAIAARAQRLVPTVSHALHDSISYEVEVSNGKVRLEVGAGGIVDGVDVDYALYVEQGTSRQAPQAYLVPAALQTSIGDLNSTAGEPKRDGIRIVSRSTRARRGRS